MLDEVDDDEHTVIDADDVELIDNDMLDENEVPLIVELDEVELEKHDVIILYFDERVEIEYRVI